MLPANSKIVTCPKCGKEMFVFQMASGNTYGSKLWSDCKLEAPMLPRVSPIFKCDACGHYYRTDNQPERYDEDDRFGEFGVFGYDDLKAAKQQFENEGADVPYSLHILLVHAYNDKFYRSKEDVRPTPSADDAIFFSSLVDSILLDSRRLDPIFVAELYRETGRFDECVELLDRCEVGDNELIAAQIKEAAMQKNSEVFVLKR